MNKMIKAIIDAKVTPEQIRRSADAAEAARRGGHDTPAEFIIIREFGDDEVDRMVIPAIMFRMTALAEAIQAKHTDNWVIEVDGTSHVLVPDALLIATAKCPLRLDDRTERLKFDALELVTLALAESDVEGSG